MRKLARQSCENGVQSSNYKFVDVFLRCLSDVEHSARTVEIELSLICGDFDDSCTLSLRSEAPRNELWNPWCALIEGMDEMFALYVGRRFAKIG